MNFDTLSKAHLGTNPKQPIANRLSQEPHTTAEHAVPLTQQHPTVTV